MSALFSLSLSGLGNWYNCIYIIYFRWMVKFLSLKDFALTYMNHNIYLVAQRSWIFYVHCQDLSARPPHSRVCFATWEPTKTWDKFDNFSSQSYSFGTFAVDSSIKRRKSWKWFWFEEVFSSTVNIKTSIKSSGLNDMKEQVSIERQLSSK